MTGTCYPYKSCNRHDGWAGYVNRTISFIVGCGGAVDTAMRNDKNKIFISVHYRRLHGSNSENNNLLSTGPLAEDQQVDRRLASQYPCTRVHLCAIGPLLLGLHLREHCY